MKCYGMLQVQQLRALSIAVLHSVAVSRDRWWAQIWAQSSRKTEEPVSYPIGISFAKMGSHASVRLFERRHQMHLRARLNSYFTRPFFV